MKNELVTSAQMQEVLKLAASNASTAESIVNSLGMILNKVDHHENDIKEIKEDVEQLKFNEEINDSQAGVITKGVRKLAREVVGYPSPLYRLAIADIYSHLKTHWRMGNKVRTTSKGNYKSVIEGLNSYKPNLEELEKRHKANLEAKEKEVN